MKTTLLITSCTLPLLVASCSSLGLYTGKHIQRAKQEARIKGIVEEQARSARARHMEQQAELEKPQPESRYYDIPVPAHTAHDGVKFESTRKTIKIITR